MPKQSTRSRHQHVAAPLRIPQVMQRRNGRRLEYRFAYGIRPTFRVSVHA